VNIPGIRKLCTVTDPFTGDRNSLERVCYDLELLSSKNKHRFPKGLVRKDVDYTFLETSSPTSLVSWLGVFTDPLAIARNGLGQTFLDYMDEMGYHKLLKL
jgi:hypothetical protein